MVAKYRPLDDYGREAADALLAVVSPNEQWRASAWPFILKALEGEGKLAEDCGPCALVVYERYVRIAAIYLSKFRDEQKKKFVVKEVRQTIAKCKAMKSGMRPNAFRKEEEDAINLAFQHIEQMIRAIEKTLLGHA